MSRKTVPWATQLLEESKSTTPHESRPVFGKVGTGAAVVCSVVWVLAWWTFGVPLLLACVRRWGAWVDSSDHSYQSEALCAISTLGMYVLGAVVLLGGIVSMRFAWWFAAWRGESSDTE